MYILKKVCKLPKNAYFRNSGSRPSTSSSSKTGASGVPSGASGAVRELFSDILFSNGELTVGPGEIALLRSPPQMRANLVTSSSDEEDEEHDDGDGDERHEQPFQPQLQPRIRVQDEQRIFSGSFHFGGKRCVGNIKVRNKKGPCYPRGTPTLVEVQ